ncbi:MAG: 3-phosphoshikimate 1-carboxyvinyltransferase [Fretibacterium sp.]|nr:3-phosphoshikimate 1-carboxyvinyltransferase [Fretibacterium sp.]
MNFRILPHPLSGVIVAPASKSEAHRLLICAALSDKQTNLRLNALSDDIEATIGCLQALGAGISQTEEGLAITPIDVRKIPDAPLLDCHESGSTLRFLLPVVAALCDHATFTGSGRLPERPIGELLNEMKKHGVKSVASKLPLEIKGRLLPGEYHLPGNVSSQYITGLLLALPLLGADSRLTLTSPLQSAAYVDITLSALSHFKVYPRVKREAPDQVVSYNIPGSSFCSPDTVAVGGDWSNAAFFLAAGALTGPVAVKGLDIKSSQGDRNVLELLKSFGAKIDVQESSVTVSPAPLHGQEIDIDSTPDLLPVLSVVAAYSEGTTTFFNGARLRLKESDRLAACAAMIQSIGGTVQELSDKIIIQGSSLTGGSVDGCHDHRIVMAAAIAALRCTGEVTVTGAEAIDKSYPNFFKDYETLGGEVHVL